MTVVNWNQELEQRLAVATPDKTTRGMFLKGILHVVSTMGDEAAVQRCMAAAGEKRITDFFSYPVTAQLRLVFAAAEALGVRHGGFEEGLRLLGRQGTTDFFSSLAGKTLLALAGNSPTKLLNNVPTAYRASSNYGQHTIEWAGPNSGRFVLSGEFMPAPYHRGVVEAVLAKAEVKGGKVASRQITMLDCECTFSWD